MRPTEAVSQLRPRLSLRGRLYLFSGAILILFAINVGTSLWGSLARNESSLAYQEAVSAAQLTAELEQNLQNKRQQILVLATLRKQQKSRSTPPLLSRQERTSKSFPSACDNWAGLEGRARALLPQVHDSATALLDEWNQFYETYNDTAAASDVESRSPTTKPSSTFRNWTRDRVLWPCSAEAIDRTITLTDQITVIGFISSSPLPWHWYSR